MEEGGKGLRQKGTHELWAYDQDGTQSGHDSLTSATVVHEPGETRRSVTPVLIRMVCDENDHMSDLIGRYMLGNFIHCVPMVDDLLKGLQVESDLFINYFTGVDESLHIFV